MARQKCVLNALLEQVSPQNAIRNFGDLAKASTETLSTNMPASEMDRFIPLAMKARDQKVATLSLVPPLINTADPDIDLIQEKVEEAIDRAEGKGGAPGKGGKRRRTASPEARSARSPRGTSPTRPTTSPLPVDPRVGTSSGPQSVESAHYRPA